jgi:HSP20 family protein
MIRWSPSTELANLHTTVDRLFEDFFATAPRDGGQRVLPTYQLPLDIREEDQGYQIQAAVPGFKPEQVEVTFTDGVLRISAQRSETRNEQGGNYLRREVAYGNFQRSIQLPGDVRTDEITADFENGILTIRVPKVPRPEPRRIQVGTSSGAQREEVLAGSAS